MRRGLIVLGVVALLLLAAYGAGSWYFSSLILANDTQSLAGAAADGFEPAGFGLPEPQDVVIDAGDVALSGWLFEHPDGDCGLMFLHGFRGTRYHSLYWASMFWERGCHVLAYDHRGHGDSTPAFHTYGYYEKHDAAAALDWFAARTSLTREDIGVFGVSYGAATALQMAPLTPGLAFVGADSAYSELEEIIDFQARHQFPVLGPLLLPAALPMAELRAGFDAEAVAPERTIVETDTPVLLIHSLTDAYTPPSHSEDIYAAADPARAVLVLTDWGAPHGRSISTDTAAYEQIIADFLAAHASGFGTPPTP